LGPGSRTAPAALVERQRIRLSAGHDLFEIVQRGETALDERGMTVKGRGDTPSQHDMLTGTQHEGTAVPVSVFVFAVDHGRTLPWHRIAGDLPLFAPRFAVREDKPKR
jgi:hypothetical protein